ncbi:class I SAM-dependent DNA methyltransferase [Clostridium rectalis]|uniref:class I SAM-dependent DNA methyltransferase n=1 Tax=Clostridium rectalis TaxID=2040295 RepID=UPI000F6333A2|nr:class I SAM-dependent methyltransferase [Clostridium rectalis]
MDCYRRFASIYDRLIKGDIDYSTWAEKILDICEEFEIEKRDYLDLACGTGNITQEISKDFINTWAVDLSYNMLTEAEEKLREKGIKGKFICQDISKLTLNKEFDLITCCLDSTNYLIKDSDIKSYFQSVFKHLKKNGIFIFDINSYYKLTNILGNNIYNYDEDDVYYIWENILEHDIVDMYLTFFVREGDLYKRFDEFHRERAYTQNYIETLIDETGFQIKQILNNYENIPIDNKCERIVYVLKR